jgi:hypothetical protein
MGVGISANTFEQRRVEGVSTPVSNYINRFLFIYGRDAGLHNETLWNNVYSSFDFKTQTFIKISQMEDCLQEQVLDESFNYSISSVTRSRSHDSIELLDYWNNAGVLDRLNKLSKDNRELDFCACYRSGASLKIPFKDDRNIIVQIKPEY